MNGFNPFSAELESEESDSEEEEEEEAGAAVVSEAREADAPEDLPNPEKRPPTLLPARGEVDSAAAGAGAGTGEAGELGGCEFELREKSEPEPPKILEANPRENPEEEAGASAVS